MKCHSFIQMILLCFALTLASCTLTTKLGDSLLPDSQYNTLVVKADAAMQDGQWAKAGELYGKASQIKPDDLSLKLKEAKAYQYDGKLALAFNTYQVIIDSKLPSSEANKKIVKAAKENQIKFGFKSQPDVVKAYEVRESPHKEPLQKDEAIEEKVMEEIPLITKQQISIEEVTQSPSQAKAFAKDNNKAILEAVNAWADAWEAKNLKVYFSHYVDDFAGGFPNARAWRQSRKIKILHSPQIKVSLSEIQVSNHQTRVEVTFKQNYESGRYQDAGRKTLEMTNVKGRWLIKKELFN